MQKPAQIRAIAKTAPYQPRRVIFAALATITLLTTLLWSQGVRAADNAVNINEDPAVQQEVADFIQNLADKALTTLNQKEYTLMDQENRFREILLEGFNVSYIGKISLGRHRKEATSQQLNSYFTLFPDYLVKIYTSRLTKLDTREVQVKTVLPNGKRDMYVRTKVIDGEQKSYDVDWRVRPEKEKAGYKIIDVKIEGISMARTQRDDFTSRISASGITGLMAYMQAIVEGRIAVPEDDKVTTPSPEKEAF